MNLETVQVNKRVKDELEARHAEFTFNYPGSVQEALDTYGQDMTMTLIHEAITLRIQGPARKALESCEAGLTPEEYSQRVSQAMNGHKIEIRRARGPAAAKISPYQQMAHDLADPEKRAAIIEKFRSLGINLEPTEVAEAGNSRRR